ncbi:dephospho-CoA kinase [bacterium]|nr:dephospho-CoA kinase [bacterium]
MLIVSLTGGIGCGKSVAAKVFQERGCYVHQADKAAHSLMEPHQPAWKKIVSHFGHHILNQDNTVNRARLGSIIFSNPQKREYLNSIIHPLVLQKKKEIINQLEREKKYKIFISEAALTIEAGYSHFFDKVVVTYCDEEVQIQRLMERDHINKTEAQKKITSQMPSQKKLEYADYIIDTSGEIQKTVEQTERIYQRLILDYQLKQKGFSQKI